jgi:hypothetical protein
MHAATPARDALEILCSLESIRPKLIDFLKIEIDVGLRNKRTRVQGPQKRENRRNSLKLR